jgi:hypothetical protein
LEQKQAIIDERILEKVDNKWSINDGENDCENGDNTGNSNKNAINSTRLCNNGEWEAIKRITIANRRIIQLDLPCICKETEFRVDLCANLQDHDEHKTARGWGGVSLSLAKRREVVEG